MADLPLPELLTRFTYALICLAAAIWAFHSFAIVWRQRQQRLRKKAEPDPLQVFRDGWDFLVDGTVAAKLSYLGPPDDLNQFFIPYQVDIMPGHRAEVETFLYGSSFDQTSNDERVSYRSRGGAAVMLKDSQVLVAYDPRQVDRIALKAMFP